MRKPIKKHSSEIWVCNKCESVEIETAKWTNVNTGFQSENVHGLDPFCSGCGNDCDIITKEEYELNYVTE